MNISNTKKYYVLMGFCLLCIMHYGYFFYSPQNTNILSTRINQGASQESAWSETARMVRHINDNSFYRIDVMDDNILNESLKLRYPSVAFYYSLYDGKITNFSKDLGNSKLHVLDMLQGNRGRTYLNLLTNVKYLVANNENEMPYGYSIYGIYKTENGSEKIIAENDLKLPFGYTVDCYFLKKNYELLSSLKKEQVMLQGAVLENKKGNMPELAPVYSDTSVPYTIKDTDGLEFKGNTICASKANATLTIHANIPESCEAFVQSQGFEFHSYNPWEYPEYYGGQGDNKYEQQLWKSRYKNWKEPQYIDVQVKSINGTQSIRFYQKNYKFYWEQDSFLFSLGCHCSGEQDITLTFSNVGEYTFSSLELLAEDMTVLPVQVEKLRIEKLEKLKFTPNKIEGTISTTGNKLLMLSIPYSTGWTAFVDGESQELICANTMWSAIYLEDEGNHNIVLQYKTPGLKSGMLISGITLLGIVTLFGISIYRKALQ